MKTEFTYYLILYAIVNTKTGQIIECMEDYEAATQRAFEYFSILKSPIDVYQILPPQNIKSYKSKIKWYQLGDEEVNL